LLQTPHRFRTKRQLWAYIGLALRTYTSGEYRFEGGQLKRSKKTLAIRGLNRNYNHDLKNIFKGAATWAASNGGPFQSFYEACLARGMKPHLARLTLARKIAAITLLLWKKGGCFDAEHFYHSLMAVPQRPTIMDKRGSETTWSWRHLATARTIRKNAAPTARQKQISMNASNRACVTTRPRKIS
jgi:hypothetical protein